MRGSGRKLPISSENADQQMIRGSLSAPLRSMTASLISPLCSQSSGNSPQPAFFQCTSDSKTDSKTGRQPWISVDVGGNSIGLWSGWKTSVDGERRGMPKGGLGRACLLVIAGVLHVLFPSYCCPPGCVIVCCHQRLTVTYDTTGEPLL